MVTQQIINVDAFTTSLLENGAYGYVTIATSALSNFEIGARVTVVQPNLTVAGVVDRCQIMDDNKTRIYLVDNTKPTITPLNCSGFILSSSPVINVLQQEIAVPVSTATLDQTTPIPIDGTISATNPSVSTVTLPSPTSATLMGGKDSFGNLQPVTVDGSGAVAISGTITASNPSVSATGSAVPADATFIAGKNGANLIPIKVDSAGVVEVTGTISATNPSVGTNSAAAPSSSTQMGAKDGANLVPLQSSTSSPSGTEEGLIVRNIPSGTQAVSIASAVTVQQATASSLNATVVQSSGSNLHVNVDSMPTTTVTGTVAATQSGTWNINNVSGTVSLPTGAATSAKQPALGTAGSASTDVITVQGIASMTALKVDGSATTQPVSGTVTVTQGTGTNLHVVVDSAPTTTVTGTVTANAGTGTFATSSTQLPSALDGSGYLKVHEQGTANVSVQNASIPVTQSGTWNINNVSGTVSLPTGAATESSLAKLTQTQGSTTSGQSGTLIQGAVTTSAPTYTTGQTDPLSLTTAGALRVDGSATTQPVSGTVTANAGSGNFTVTQATGTNLHVVVDTAPTTTVTGTVAATQSGTWDINNVSGTVSLPTGAATSAKQPALGTAGAASTDVITVQGIASMTALKVDGSATTQPVSGTVTANAGSGNFTVVQSTGTNLHVVVDTAPTTTVTGTVAATQSGTWTVQESQSTSMAMTGINVSSSSATALSGSLSASRTTLIVANNGPEAIFVGTNSVTATNGDFIAAGAKQIYSNISPSLVLYAIALTTTQSSPANTRITEFA